MKISIEYNIENCRECPYSTNSSIEHNCAFTSAPNPTQWWCTHIERDEYHDIILDPWVIDKHCPIKEGKC